MNDKNLTTGAIFVAVAGVLGAIVYSQFMPKTSTQTPLQNPQTPLQNQSYSQNDNRDYDDSDSEDDYDDQPIRAPAYTAPRQSYTAPQPAYTPPQPAYTPPPQPAYTPPPQPAYTAPQPDAPEQPQYTAPNVPDPTQNPNEQNEMNEPPTETRDNMVGGRYTRRRHSHLCKSCKRMYRRRH